MNLRKYSIIMTGIAAASLATLIMWECTKCDVLCIFLTDALISVVTTIMAASSDGWYGDISEFRRVRKNRKKERELYIYDIR